MYIKIKCFILAHYSSICEELPVQLCLPKILRDTNNRQQLSSLALLGQEFWRCSMSSPKSPTSNFIKSPTDSSSGIGLTMFGSNTDDTFAQHHSQLKLNNESGCLSPMSDTISTMSSFSLNNTQSLMSPMSATSSSCTEVSPAGIVGKTSTFKIPHTKSLTEPLCAEPGRISIASSECSRSSHSGNNNVVFDLPKNQQRPTPPNTLNLNLTKTPPLGHQILMSPAEANNFTLTFTFSTRSDATPTQINVS